MTSRTPPDPDPSFEGIDGQLLGPDPLGRGESAQQDVVDAGERARLLQGEEVPRLLDDADQGGVAAGVAADRAEGDVGLGQVEAGLAVADALLDRSDRLGQRQGLLGRAP